MADQTTNQTTMTILGSGIVAEQVRIAALREGLTVSANPYGSRLATYVSGAIDPMDLQEVTEQTILPQGTDLLGTTQDGVLLRTFLDQLNVNIAPYATIVSLDDIYEAIPSIGYPALLHPIQTWQGQHELVINEEVEVPKAGQLLAVGGSFVLESMVEPVRLLSITAVKSKAGNLVVYPTLSLTKTNDGKLRVSSTPNLDEAVKAEAKAIATEIGNNLNYVGAFTVRLTETGNETLYVDGLIPTVGQEAVLYNATTNHNAFDVHLRALFGWALPELQEVANGVVQFFSGAEFAAIERERLVQGNWQFDFTPVEGMDEKADAGFVTLVGDDLDDLEHQLSASEIW